MTLYAYTAWDGMQDAISPSPTAMLEALSNDLLQSGDLTRALHEFLRHADPSPDGTQAVPGGVELRQDVAPQQQEDLPPSVADARQLAEQQVQQLEAFLQQAGLVRRTASLLQERFELLHLLLSQLA